MIPKALMKWAKKQIACLPLASDDCPVIPGVVSGGVEQHPSVTLGELRAWVKERDDGQILATAAQHAADAVEAATCYQKMAEDEREQRKEAERERDDAVEALRGCDELIDQHGNTALCARDAEILDKMKAVLERRPPRVPSFDSLRANEAERRLKAILTNIGADGADDETAARLHALTALYNALGFDTAHPVTEMLTKLTEAADILLNRHDYDGHGWELIHGASHRSAEMVKAIGEAAALVIAHKVPRG